MHERVRQEIELVHEKHPQARHGDDLSWVCIPEYPLPAGRFNRKSTMLAFRVAPGYPQTGPDNFFVDGDLRLINGSSPPGFNQGSNPGSGVCPVPGEVGWFSWHPASWCPTASIAGGDNLLTFLRSVDRCLEGQEAT